jgi:transcription elongation factor GreB
VSKAFVNEDSVTEAPVVRAAPRLAAGEKRYITQEGYERLHSELLSLQQSLRGSSQRARVEAQIQELEALLGLLTVVRPDEAREQAFFGAWVEVEDEDGATLMYRLVGPDEADAKRGLVSVDSPLGRALLGRSSGDTVSVTTPRGSRELTVQRISYAKA